MHTAGWEHCYVPSGTPGLPSTLVPAVPAVPAVLAPPRSSTSSVSPLKICAQRRKNSVSGQSCPGFGCISPGGSSGGGDDSGTSLGGGSGGGTDDHSEVSEAGAPPPNSLSSGTTLTRFRDCASWNGERPSQFFAECTWAPCSRSRLMSRRLRAHNLSLPSAG